MNLRIKIWFFTTADGSLISTFAHTELGARMDLRRVFRCHLLDFTLLPSPIMLGRDAHMLHMAGLRTGTH